ncbi:hypothetical protein Hanom_Chr14g01313391 [Helianthus anomalus]
MTLCIPKKNQQQTNKQTPNLNLLYLFNLYPNNPNPIFFSILTFQCKYQLFLNHVSNDVASLKSIKSHLKRYNLSTKIIIHY